MLNFFILFIAIHSNISFAQDELGRGLTRQVAFCRENCAGCFEKRDFEVRGEFSSSCFREEVIPYTVEGIGMVHTSPACCRRLIKQIPGAPRCVSIPNDRVRCSVDSADSTYTRVNGNPVNVNDADRSIQPDRDNRHQRPQERGARAANQQ